MSLDAEFRKAYPELDPADAIVGEDGPYPFCGGEMTEIWYEEADEYGTCYYLQHPLHGTRVLRDFAALCAFVNGIFTAG